MVNAEVGAMILPWRFPGLGAVAGLPIFQNSVFDFSDAETAESFDNFPGYGSYGTSDIKERFVPDVYDYSFNQSPSVTFLARFMTNQWVNGLYLDLRYSLMAVTEN